MAGDRACTFMPRMSNYFFIFVDCHKQRIISVYEDSPAVELSEQKDKLVTENWRD